MFAQKDFYQEINIRDQIIRLIKNPLETAKLFGANHFGYRYFLYNGNSYGFSSNDLWYAIKRDKTFFAMQREYLGTEICFLVQNKLDFVTRSPNQDENKYFEELDHRNMTNSVGIYRFSKDKIEHFFFISSNKNCFAKDLLINNLHNFQKLVDKSLLPLINQSLKSVLGNNHPIEFTLDEQVINYAFSKKNSSGQKKEKDIKVSFKNQVISLTHREFEIIFYLNKGYSNLKVAAMLNVSAKTVEWFITKLRNKFNCTRNQLALIVEHINTYSS